MPLKGVLRLRIWITYLLLGCVFFSVIACADAGSAYTAPAPYESTAESVITGSPSEKTETENQKPADDIIVVDDVIWAVQPDVDLNRLDVDYPENSLVILNRLNQQFQAYEDHPEQRFAVAVGFLMDIGTFQLTSEMRETEEHRLALEHRLTWNGLDAETALQYYEHHACHRKGKEETYIYQSDDLWCQYLNVIFQDVYAEYRSCGIEVIVLQEPERFQSTGIPGTVLLIGTQEQIRSIQNDKPYVWYVGLAEYHKIYLEDNYYENTSIKNGDFVCFNPFYELINDSSHTG